MFDAVARQRVGQLTEQRLGRPRCHVSTHDLVLGEVMDLTPCLEEQQRVAHTDGPLVVTNYQVLLS